MKKLGLLGKLVLGILAGILLGFLSKEVDNYVIVRIMSTFSGLFGNFL